MSAPGYARGDDPEAVVRVPERRRQGRAAVDRRPRILMSPGTSARSAPRVVAVQTPLVADAGQRVKAEHVRLAVHDARGPGRASSAGVRIAPGKAGPNAAAGSMLPPRLGGQRIG